MCLIVEVGSELYLCVVPEDEGCGGYKKRQRRLSEFIFIGKS